MKFSYCYSYVCSKGVIGVRLHNFAVIAIVFFLTDEGGSIMTRIHRRSIFRLNFWRPSTKVVAIGMENLSLVTLLFKYLNRYSG